MPKLRKLTKEKEMKMSVIKEIEEKYKKYPIIWESLMTENGKRLSNVEKFIKYQFEKFVNYHDILDKIITEEGINKINVGGKSYLILAVHFKPPLVSITEKIIAKYSELIIEQLHIDEQMQKEEIQND